MDWASCLPRSTSNGQTSLLSGGPGETNPHPPRNYQQTHKLRVRTRAIFGHCFYRRTVLWSTFVLLLLGMTVYKGGFDQPQPRSNGPVEWRQGRRTSGGSLDARPGFGSTPKVESRKYMTVHRGTSTASPNSSRCTQLPSARAANTLATQPPSLPISDSFYRRIRRLTCLQPDSDSHSTKKPDSKEKTSPSLKSDALPSEQADFQQEDEIMHEDQAEPPDVPGHQFHWMKYQHLDGYFTGLKALVPFRQHKAEYPRPEREKSSIRVERTGLPTSAPYMPHPDYESAEYLKDHAPVKSCFLDKDKKIPVPETYGYSGVVQGMPNAALGGYKVLGLRNDVCFDRFGRLGPYGLGYGQDEGGSGVGVDTEMTGSEQVWNKTGRIDYRNMDWGDAQERCYLDNKDRFVFEGKDFGGTASSPSALPVSLTAQTKGESKDFVRAALNWHKAEKGKKMDRIAIVVRTYAGFEWRQHAILNFRALISEVALRSGGEYVVHFLLQVKDEELPVWADEETAQKVLEDQMPAEFRSITTLWTERQIEHLYPGKFEPEHANPSGTPVLKVFRSAHLSLQLFALTHPQYSHFWNWEMDMRYIGNYYELFDRIHQWSKQQSRDESWERAQKYYIPYLHGSWEKFRELVHHETKASGRKPVFGPTQYPGRKPLRLEESNMSFWPANCTKTPDGVQKSSRKNGDKDDSDDSPECGVGEDADLITLNPIFDVTESGWVFTDDGTGYEQLPPRRASIVTASRLSRRLLAVMHEETWRLRHAMFSEMFPATMALHHGLKAIFAPHPVYIDRRWNLHAVDKHFNGGRDHTTSGPGCPFQFGNEHLHLGTTWYYNSNFGGMLWRRWLGYAQMDGRPKEGHPGDGTLRGGPEEEGKPDSSGRLCLRSMLVHPVKQEDPGARN